MKKIKNDSQPYRIYIFAIICLPFAASFVGLCFYLSLLVFDGFNFWSIFGTLLPIIFFYLTMIAIKNVILYYLTDIESVYKCKAHSLSRMEQYKRGEIVEMWKNSIKELRENERD